jgi:hypothetical protein
MYLRIIIYIVQSINQPIYLYLSINLSLFVCGLFVSLYIHINQFVFNHQEIIIRVVHSHKNTFTMKILLYLVISCLALIVTTLHAEEIEVSADGEIIQQHYATTTTTTTSLEKQVQELRERVDELERYVYSSKSTRTNTISSSDKKFEDHVVLRHDIEIEFDFTIISILSLHRRRAMYDRAKKRRHDMPQTLILIGDREGRLHVRFPNGTKINSTPMETGHKTPIIHLRYDFADRSEPTIVTVAEDGSVHVNRVTLFAHNRLLLGRWRRRLKDNEEEEEKKEAPKKPQGVSMTMELESVLVDTSERTGESTTLTAIENVYVREKHLVLLGDSSGRIRVFDVNGTVLTVVEKPSFQENEELSPVADVKQIGSRVAFAIGRHVQIFDVMASPERSLRCPPTPSTITSISFDLLRPSYLFVSTADSILTYRMSGKGRKLSEYTCQIIHRATDVENEKDVIFSGMESRTESVRGYVVRWSSSSGS